METMQQQQQQQQQQHHQQPEMDSLDKIIFSSNFALSDGDLMRWCKQNGLSEVGVIDLTQLAESSSTLSSRQNFIFTGAQDNQYNGNNDHHWLAHDGNLIFDSYGSYSDYKLPQNFEFFKTQPNRLQEFNTSVCGAYCCAFLKFLSENEEASTETLEDEFVEQFQLTTDRKENDKKILSWYVETGGKFADTSKPLPVDNSNGAGINNECGSSQDSKELVEESETN